VDEAAIAVSVAAIANLEILTHLGLEVSTGHLVCFLDLFDPNLLCTVQMHRRNWESKLALIHHSGVRTQDKTIICNPNTQTHGLS
jgi:hypothetical protein